MKGVRVHSESYEKVVARYDGPETFFFDPPYAGTSTLDVTATARGTKTGEKDFDEEKFFKVLKGIKGKWILTYGTTGELPAMMKKAGYKAQKLVTYNPLRTTGDGTLTQLVFSNYKAKLRKGFGALPPTVWQVGWGVTDLSKRNDGPDTERVTYPLDLDGVGSLVLDNPAHIVRRLREEIPAGMLAPQNLKDLVGRDLLLMKEDAGELEAHAAVGA